MGGEGNNRYPIRNNRAHTRNHDYRPPVPESEHLLRHRLSRHEHARDVDFKHHVRVLGRVLQRRGFLLDPRRGDQAVQSPVLVAYASDDSVQVVHISHVDLLVIQCRS